MRGKLILMALAGMLVVAPALAQELMADDFIGKFKAMSAGQKAVLAYENGRTLYTSEKDEAGKSNCEAACAEAWPPALALDEDKAFEDFTIITRGDGKKQWAFKGKPLYMSSRDTANGQANGHAVNEQWYVVEVAVHEM